MELTLDGFTGDRVSDRNVHGGPDKAALVFPAEHYSYYAELLGREMAVPAFGENLTVEGWIEEEACIGDTLCVGTAIVQVSQPRQPCFKLALKHEQPRMIQWVNDKGWTGFYVRVLTPGRVAPGDAITLRDRPHPDLTVMSLTRMRFAAPDATLMERLSLLPELAASWREQIRRRLHPDEFSDDEA